MRALAVAFLLVGCGDGKSPAVDAPPGGDAAVDVAIDAPLVCEAGRGNCNELDADGCEVDLGRAEAHCGACDAVPCDVAKRCIGGTCTDGGRFDWVLVPGTTDIDHGIALAVDPTGGVVL